MIRLAPVCVGLFSLGVAVSAFLESAHAETVQLGAAFGTATKDTMIFQNNPNNGAGGAPGFFAGTNSQPSIRRGLLSFDVSSIPSGSTITGVSLQLKIGQIAGSGGGGGGGGFSNPVVGLHKLLVDWGEANTGASTATGLGGTGQGSPAELGDATWNERFNDGNNSVISPTAGWTAPGGQAGIDYVAGASASAALGNTLNDLAVWASSPGLVADVQSWLDDPATNFGWMLINTNETASQTFRGFYSRNYNPNGVPDLAAFPVLSVNYVVPEPSTWALFAGGLIGLCLGRLRRSGPRGE